MELKNIGKGIAVGFGIALTGLCIYMPYKLEQEDPDGYMGWARRAPQPVDFPAPMTVDENIRTLLPTLASTDPQVRRTGVDALALSFAQGAAGDASAEVREDAAHALIDVFDEADGTQKEGLQLKKDALTLVLAKVGSTAGQEFALSVLESDTETMKTVALEALAKPGAMRNKTVLAKAYEVARQDFVPGKLKPAVYRRALGKKSEPEILALMDLDATPATLIACAIELQNMHNPDTMGPVLARLEAVGLLEDAKKMPWFSGGLLAKHIAVADGAELVRALRVVWLRPSLTRTTMKSVQERLAHADPAIRRIVARIIPDAVKYKGIEAVAGEDILTARLAQETDPVVKGELEGSLTQVRNTRRAQESTETPSAPVE